MGDGSVTAEVTELRKLSNFGKFFINVQNLNQGIGSARLDLAVFTRLGSACDSAREIFPDLVRHSTWPN